MNHRETRKTARPLSGEELREMLVRKRQELLARIRRERGDIQEGSVELADGPLGDLADRPVLTPDAEIGYEVVAHRARILAQVDLALKRIEDGSYGQCEMCDQPIAPARLRALPFAIRCTRCQEEWERRSGREVEHAGELVLE